MKEKAKLKTRKAGKDRGKTKKAKQAREVEEQTREQMGQTKKQIEESLKRIERLQEELIQKKVGTEETMQKLADISKQIDNSRSSQ